MSYRLSAKRKSFNQIQVESILIEPPLKVDYSRACFICGTILTSIVGFCKHRKFQHCSNHYQKLLTAKSTGGSSFPEHMNAVVRDSRENYLSEADNYDEADYKLLTKYVEEAGLRSISKIFDSSSRYVILTRYVQAGYNVNFPLSVFLFDLSNLASAPKGRVAINTPSGSIGDCISFLVSFTFIFIFPPLLFF